ncbi:alpha/beta fold hydrolase [Chitinimonas sp.]|uniref:alpha/beta fold hydrolase n=1 Tax=Chitinimonas sp. TaxID=1934313 RepID=UPI0035B3F2C9
MFPTLARTGALIASLLPLFAAADFAPSNDGQIYFERHGSAHGAPVVLIPGGPGGNHTFFQPWFERLHSQHELVYFDAIDRGRSDRLPASKLHSVPRDATDIEALRLALHAEKLVLLGNSYGSLPAIEYSLQHPERVACLIISSGMHSDASFADHVVALNRAIAEQYPAHWDKLEAMYAQGVKSGSEAYQNLYGEVADNVYWFDPRNAAKRYRSPDPRDAFRGAVYAAFMGDDSERVVNGALKGYDLRPRMAALQLPVLVITGRRDIVASPRIAAETVAALSKARVSQTIVERAGHRAFIENPDEYFAAVQRFLLQTPDCRQQ